MPSRLLASWNDSSRSSRLTAPDFAFVAGDVNSTLASALVLVKLGVPYGHVESGLRSFDRSMPEEINRIVADEFADLLFAHSDDAVENLRSEGIASERIHLVGNTMIDTLCRLEPRFRRLRVAEQLGLQSRGFVLVTLHRPSLVDGTTSSRGPRTAPGGRPARAGRLSGASTDAGTNPRAPRGIRTSASSRPSDISSSSPWKRMPERSSRIPAASRRRRPFSACRASRSARPPSGR